MTAPAQDPYLALPLDGVRAIEASAGTGKTYTLATLVLRLLVERDLRIGEILAVTFTEAATQELRARIRARLLLAATLVDAPPCAQAAPEAALTRALLEAHRARSGEPAAALRRRLRLAAEGIDLAAVFTIHGFCARVLREYALETGHGFDAPTLLTNDAALREEIAADLWRAHGADAETADDLLALWKAGPEALARDLTPLLREPALRPPAAAPPADPRPALRAAAAALAEAFHAHGARFRTDLVAAVENKVLNGQSYRTDWLGALFDALATWCAHGDFEAPFADARLGKLAREALAAKTNRAQAGRTPDSPLCDAIPGYLAALAATADYRDARRVALLHRLRDDARARLALRKRQLRVQTYDDLIDGVADALERPPSEGGQAEALVRRLRAQYRVALVDEFQDTDPRQWRIFDRVFGRDSGDPALFLIGDPKQAIYGFRGGDVETYLDACATADAAPPLRHNFRARPALLRAVDALYAQAEAAFAQGAADAPPFVDARIRLHAIDAGGTRGDGDFLRDGAPAAALTLWQAPPPADAGGKAKPYAAGVSRGLAAHACVAAIHRVLRDARAGRARIDGRGVRPGDIAVLVRTHREATRIRQALTAAGIPAVAAGRQSLYATEEARELHTLLLALLHGADDGRLRAALATVLIGVDAAALAALDADGAALRDWQLRALAWRECLQRGGALALVGDLCAEHGQRLLALLDGERRLSNYLQLAEALAEAQLRTLGLHGLVDWLERAIAEADDSDDTQLLRLESDAQRVQVVTLHKSKGLEYPLVFLPFAGIGGQPPDPGQRVAIAEAGIGRALHWKLLPATSGWDAAKAQWLQAQRAEDARLLYVGLTRAQHALWLASGPFYQHARSALAPMLHDLGALRGALGATLDLDDAPPPVALPWLPPETDGEIAPARTATRVLAGDWWVYSFTQLAHADAGHEPAAAATEAPGAAADEPAPALGTDIAAEFASEDFGGALAPHDDGGADIGAGFGGSRFGNVLHAALERADFAAWRGWRPEDPAPGGERALLVEALRGGGYAQQDTAAGIALLTALVGRTLTAELPEGGALCAIPAHQRRAEIEFHFAMAPTAVPALLALLHAHDVVRERRGFGLRRRLEGLMTGKIDLTYVRDGRWYLLDYKSNRLPRYDAAALAAAMAHSEYDLQALIYTLALHRWLRLRLGDGYDYARDFGGFRYLFCRGLEGAPRSPLRSPSQAPLQSPPTGIVAQRYDAALVHALDALFAGAAVPPPPPPRAAAGASR